MGGSRGGHTLWHPGGGVLVRKVARFRPTGEADKLQVLCWNGGRWGPSGPFGIATMTLDRALDYVIKEPNFRLHT